MNNEPSLTEYKAKLLWWAKAYCSRGWKILPVHTIDSKGNCTCFRGKECKAPGKHPRVTGWQQTATDDIVRVRRWIEKTDGLMNIGIACGIPSGVSVLDIDGEEGLDSLAKLEGQYSSLPETLRAITGSGGAHIIFDAFEEGVKNRVKIQEGIDIRHTGSFIVAAPSLHKSGEAYEWATDFDMPIAASPEWVTTIIHNLPSKRSSSRGFDFRKWLKKQSPSIEGENGSAQCMRVAAKAVRAGKIRNFDVFARELAEWNESCEPPWTQEELLHKFDSAIDSWDSEGRVDLPLNRAGNPISNLQTLVEVLREDSIFADTLAFDSAIGTVLYHGEPMLDKDVVNIRHEIISGYNGMKAPKTEILDAITKVSYDASFNSIEDYLRNIEWDGKKRLHLVPKVILRTENTKLYREYIKRWFIGAVARAMNPGCKLDTALIFKGPQGSFKSTFFETLADPWYVDSMLDLNSKDSYQNLARAWIYEWSEIETVYSAKDISRVKAFLSSKVDVYRAPYGYVAESHPRHTVFVGSTNKDEILHDPTGSRRFWIVDISNTINMKRLRAWKDQLWSEAFSLWDSGKRWYLPHKLGEVAEKANQAYLPESPLGDRAIVVASQLRKEKPDGFRLADLGERLGIDFTRKDMRVQQEITRALKLEGYTSKQVGKNRLRVWIKKKA